MNFDKQIFEKLDQYSDYELEQIVGNFFVQTSKELQTKELPRLSVNPDDICKCHDIKFGILPYREDDDTEVSRILGHLDCLKKRDIAFEVAQNALLEFLFWHQNIMCQATSGGKEINYHNTIDIMESYFHPLQRNPNILFYPLSIIITRRLQKKIEQRSKSFV
ncbi:MAG: hypothetical protein ACEPOV_11215 [Hyphomicrobiales bacterium]